MDQAKTKKELLILDQETIDALDFFSEKLGFSRSAVARAAITQYYQWYSWAAAQTRPKNHSLPDGSAITVGLPSAELASVEA